MVVKRPRILDRKKTPDSDDEPVDKLRPWRVKKKQAVKKSSVEEEKLIRKFEGTDLDEFKL